jgi:predicted ferric reductase
MSALTTPPPSAPAPGGSRSAHRSAHRAGPPRPASPGWWKDAVSVATWASLLAVGALWIADGGIQNLAGTAGLLKGTGQLTGLIAADLLLLQVLMMARIPLVERAYGQDELAHRHRLIGFTSFNLMLAHIALITLGYAADSGTGVLPTFVELVLTDPGMLLATAGTLMLVLVVVTSIRAARDRLRRESWHLLHLYAYSGVALALPHQLWTGGDFLSSPVATAYWWTLWALAALAIVQFRVVAPLVRSWRHRLVVERVVPEAPGVVSVYLTGRDLSALAVRAGQFFSWRFLAGPGWTRANPYSLSAAPDGRTLRITVKDLGDGSARVATLRRGTRVMFEGPYGRLSGAARTRRRVAFVASGIGITPIRAMLEEFAYAPGEATLLYRTSTLEHAVFRAELDELAARRGVRVLYLPGRRSPDPRSWLPAEAGALDPATALRDLVPDLTDADVFVCGPESWMDAVESAAERAGVPAGQVHSERFAF